jgi:hypothetical protein
MSCFTVTLQRDFARRAENATVCPVLVVCGGRGSRDYAWLCVSAASL